MADPDEAREIHAFSFVGPGNRKQRQPGDFSPYVVPADAEELEPAPKVSSARESVESSGSRIPGPTAAHVRQPAERAIQQSKKEPIRIPEHPNQLSLDELL